MKKRIISIMLLVCFISIFSFNAMAATDKPEGHKPDNGDEPFTLESPENLTAELKYDQDNMPYFEIKLDIPQSVKEIDAKLIEDSEYYKGKSCYPIEIQIEYKYGNYDWNEGPSLYWNTSIYLEDFINDGVYQYRPFQDVDDAGAVNIKEEVYSFRAYFYSLWGYEGDWIDFRVVSDYSNIATVGNTAYYSGASDWAIDELDKAARYGLITSSIKDKMREPITREEFAELVVLLYEKTTKEAVQPESPNPFTDTGNPEVLKAYKLGIVTGVGNNKFDPKALTNREQVATMLSRAVRVMVPDADFSIDGAPTFSDEEHISGWALEHVKYMSKIGVIKGSDGKFMPKAVTTAEAASGYATTTCEQATLMAVRIYEKFKDE
ncbi:MAG: S-layer homology domain-containing protein [Clostridiaceae bacterium]|nr:S-layer homology domain-containing protein [Clostridiaceae bacterium]